MDEASPPGLFELDREDGRAPAYNESAFRYFLSIERKRSERSSRPLALLLVNLKRQPGMTDRIDSEVAGRLFSELSRCLRETDFIGWYRDARVAGAVLTELGETSAEAVQHLRRRVGAVFEGLSQDVFDSLQIRIYHLPAQAQELGENRS